MGIFVPSATLPSGIQLNNVYMSFAGEVIFVTQTGKNMAMPTQPEDDTSHQWRISSSYNVFNQRPSRMSTGLSNIKVPFATTVKIFDQNPYTHLYKALMDLYPGSTKVIDSEEIIPPVPTSNLVISNDILVGLYKDINSDSNSYVITQGTSNLTLTTDAFSQLSNAIGTFTFTPVPVQTISN